MRYYLEAGTNLEIKARERKEPSIKEKKNVYRYFSDNWRYGTYFGAGVAIIISLVLGFAIGKYRPELPYIIPSGNATRD